MASAKVIEGHYRCDKCGKVLVSGNKVIVVSDKGVQIHLCEKCFEKLYAVCSECKNVFRKDEMIYDEFEGKWYCDECWHESRPIDF